MLWVDCWRTEIPGDAPCGEDVSFHPEFERLQDEIEKSASIYADNQTDWDIVFICANAILNEISKDIWVLCYGARAAYAKGGTSWLATALGILNGYLENYWEDLHPQRPRRRLAALQWLCNKLETLFANEQPILSEETDSGNLRESLKRLQDLLDAHFLEEAPSLSAIIRNLPGVAPPLPDDTPGTLPVSASLAPASQIQQPPSASPLPTVPATATVLSSEILTQVNRNTADHTRRLAAHYLSLNYLDWRGYLLNRVALWTTIPQLPSVDGNGITTMRPLPKDRLNGYQSAIQTKQFASILPALERSAANQPYWLDGHFMVFQCLDALGAKDAQDAVLSTLKSFLHLFSDVKDYRYFDSTPFASPATLQWIEIQEHSSEAGEMAEVALSNVAVGAVQSPLCEEDGLLKTAIEKGGEEGFEAGLSLLGTTISLRSRMAVKNAILQARYCLAMKKPTAAKQLLAAIYRQLDQWDLIDWEPELSAQVITFLSALQKGKAGKDQDEMRRRLYWLHLRSALKINPEE